MFKWKQHLHVSVCVRVVGEDQRFRLSHVWCRWEMTCIKCGWHNLVQTNYNLVQMRSNGMCKRKLFEVFKRREIFIFPSLHPVRPKSSRGRVRELRRDFERERENKVWRGEKAWRGTQKGKWVVVGWMEVLWYGLEKMSKV